MKRIFSVFLAVLLMVSVFGCGKGDSQQTGGSNVETSSKDDITSSNSSESSIESSTTESSTTESSNVEVPVSSEQTQSNVTSSQPQQPDEPDKPDPYKIDIDLTKGDRGLVWYDCFTGTTIREDVWQKGTNVTAADIKMSWDEKNLSINDGELTLTCDYDHENPGFYTTPYHLITKNKMQFKYGYFEIKAKIPFYKGNSAAFWFLSPGKTAEGYGSEIDMVELMGRTDNVVSNLHAWGPRHFANDGVINRDNRSHTFTTPVETLRNEYHTYSMNWTPEFIEFAVDGDVYFKADITDAGVNKLKSYGSTQVLPNMDMFHLPIYLVLSEFLYSPARKFSYSLKGNETDMPYVMTVDHVALYQGTGESLYLFD